MIEAASQRTVAEIFRDYGEADFRRREREAVEQLSTQEQIVLALGGGAVEDECTRSLLIHSPENCLVFLDAHCLNCWRAALSKRRYARYWLRRNL